ncbi:MAG: TIGR00374 family protein, partial [Deltaproteobacteria bacterium]
MRLGPAFTRKILIGMALAALVYLGMSLWSGFDRLLLVLRAFPWPWLVAVFGLSLVNYGVRFLRWQAYLRALSVEIPWGKSLRIFLSGFVLTITPGKAGEVVK